MATVMTMFPESTTSWNSQRANKYNGPSGSLIPLSNSSTKAFPQQAGKLDPQSSIVSQEPRKLRSQVVSNPPSGSRPSIERKATTIPSKSSPKRQTKPTARTETPKILKNFRKALGGRIGKTSSKTSSVVSRNNASSKRFPKVLPAKSKAGKELKRAAKLLGASSSKVTSNAKSVSSSTSKSSSKRSLKNPRDKTNGSSTLQIRNAWANWISSTSKPSKRTTNLSKRREFKTTSAKSKPSAARKMAKISAKAWNDWKSRTSSTFKPSKNTTNLSKRREFKTTSAKSKATAVRKMDKISAKAWNDWKSRTSSTSKRPRNTTDETTSATKTKAKPTTRTALPTRK